ncbi:MAG: aminopeptidase P family protein [Oscillospiraceae bacterium]|nr:aminopeptidase P family protein [Oscillospiraceae bacterium]
MTVPERLNRLRRLMVQRGLDAYVVPTGDFHGSEYVGDYFKARAYLSGFTGSAGTLVVLAESAFLWTDGRYFLQAAQQLEGSGIELMPSGQPGVPALETFLAETVPEGGRIGFDGRVVSRTFAKRLEEKTGPKHIQLVGGEDLAGLVWEDRPALSARPVWELDAETAGQTRREKLRRAREALAPQGDWLLLSALDDVAWLLNLRGDDVQYTPVFLSYLLLSREEAQLFVNPAILSGDIRAALQADGVELFPYEAAAQALARLPAGQTLLADPDTVSQQLVQSIPQGVHVAETASPVARMKAVKNPTEMENLRLAHIKDGAAVTQFLFWLHQNVGRQRITELSAAEQLERFRARQEGYLGPSFAPILAYGPHGAIVHYEPTAQSDVPLEPHGFCLADTGGHYLQGTTDITRTIPLGPLTGEEKRAYTLVLRGHLNLAAAVFPQGVSGCSLDCLARQPLWEQGLDFNHGTGHGVGYLLNVHEGPHSIHWRPPKSPVPLEEGMVVSDEPGLYLEGKFGVRHENLLLCRRGETTPFGQFLRFQPLTLVPFDREALDLSLLDERERELLNGYHAQVRAALSPLLSARERAWLEEKTAPI